MTEIHPALRASLDRELSCAVDSLLAKAAEHDGKDLIEANVDLTNDLLAGLLSRGHLAAAAAALALRAHRQQIRDLVQEIREQEDLVTALRRDGAKKATQIRLLMQIVDQWTQAWEARGGEVLRVPLGEPEAVVSHAELPAEVIVQTIEQAERHANQGETS